jgi:hypothetical protein
MRLDQIQPRSFRSCRIPASLLDNTRPSQRRYWDLPVITNGIPCTRASGTYRDILILHVSTYWVGIEVETTEELLPIKPKEKYQPRPDVAVHQEVAIIARGDINSVLSVVEVLEECRYLSPRRMEHRFCVMLGY